ncbi:MAG: hypothetical protein CM15mP49_25760 [Actinomycetota bacterium]|nr:MAG: hypothetical protein CM15mP49_25760 [Actinomycetota bacterium]
MDRSHVASEGTLAHDYIEPLGYQCFEEHPDAIPVEAKAGSIVIFSSLTPHMTGANTTTETRKPTFSSTHRKDRFYSRVTLTREARNTEAANEPNRQFVVLKDGLPEI